MSECVRRVVRVSNQDARELLSEMLGTFVLVLFAVGAGFQYTLSRGALGSFLTVNLANGVAVTLAIYTCGGVSGGCINPSVSLAMCLTKRLPWKRLPFHVTGQFLGAFLASCLMYGIYHEALDNFDGGNRTLVGPQGTGGIFSSFPQDYLSAAGGLVDQIVGTGMLILCSLAVVDTRNLAPSSQFSAIPVGLAVFAIGATLGMNCGYPINPARDLGPRIFLLIGGWGTEAFSYRNYNWFWVPVVGPLVGSALFTLVYSLFVQFHWPSLTEFQDQEMKIQPENTTTGDGNIKKPIKGAGLAYVKSQHCYDNETYNIVAYPVISRVAKTNALSPF